MSGAGLLWLVTRHCVCERETGIGTAHLEWVWGIFLISECRAGSNPHGSALLQLCPPRTLPISRSQKFLLLQKTVPVLRMWTCSLAVAWNPLCCQVLVLRYEISGPLGVGEALP